MFDFYRQALLICSLQKTELKSQQPLFKEGKHIVVEIHLKSYHLPSIWLNNQLKSTTEYKYRYKNGYKRRNYNMHNNKNIYLTKQSFKLVGTWWDRSEAGSGFRTQNCECNRCRALALNLYTWLPRTATTDHVDRHILKIHSAEVHVHYIRANPKHLYDS